jgi:two-component system sensor kinase FixL
MELAVGEVHLPGRRLFTGITRDISSRRALEVEARRRLAELAHVSRLAAMGEMATVLAHEVNQPLTAIISHATACLRLIARGKAEDGLLTESLTQIARQGERAGEVIKRLRRFVSKAEMEFRPSDLNATVRDVLWLLGHELRGARVEMTLELQGDLPMPAMDAVQIEQVVFNLVRNALEALGTLPEGQPRRLRLATTATDDGEGVALTVEDDGPGFPGIEPAQLFEPYFTTKAGGLGQGLAICRSIIEAHAGRIDAEAAEPRGARFRFVLPLSQPA